MEGEGGERGYFSSYLFLFLFKINGGYRREMPIRAFSISNLCVCVCVGGADREIQREKSVPLVIPEARSVPSTGNTFCESDLVGWTAHFDC